MTKEQVTKFRESAGKNAFTIQCDNDMLFTANTFYKAPNGLPKEYIFWDDANELFYSIRLTETVGESPRCIEFTQVRYDDIQFLRINCDRVIFKAMAEGIGESIISKKDILNMENAFSKELLQSDRIKALNPVIKEELEQRNSNKK